MRGLPPFRETNYDGAGQPMPSDSEVDYISYNADRLGISEDEAVELYESTIHDPYRCALGDAEPMEIEE